MTSGENYVPSTSAESVNDPTIVYEPDPEEANSEAVVAALSSALGTAETEMPPIYEEVDPDALNSLFRGRDGVLPRDGRGHVAFDYESHRVRVESDGTVFVF